MKAYRIYILGFLLVAGIAVVARPHLFFHRSHGVRADRQAFDRLARGMTEPQIEAVIGGPAGHYDDARSVMVPMAVTGSVTQKEWTTREGYIKVWFDANGQAMTIFYSDEGGTAWH